MKVLELKYAAVPFGRMDHETLMLNAKALLAKIHVIVGWTIPDNELRTILGDQFAKKLVESYPNVNHQEMEFAFRKSTGVQDWGKNMNLALIDEVMLPYLDQRRDISDQEERLMITEQNALPAPPMSEEEVMDMAESTWIALKNYALLPIRAYDILYRNGKIKLSDQQKTEIKRLVNLRLDQMLKEDKNLFNDVPRSHMETRFCKKMAVAEYLQNKINDSKSTDKAE